MRMAIALLICLLSCPQLLFCQKTAEAKTQMTKDILEATYCDIAKEPNLYVGKVTRLKATFIQATEGQYLQDPWCKKELKLGVGYKPDDEKSMIAVRKVWEKIHSQEYAGRANVVVTGILRAESRHDFVWYDYRFDISAFESVSHAVIPYEGYLDANTTYRAEVECNKDFGLTPVIPQKTIGHGYAVRFEWTNLNKFSEFKDAKKKDCRRTVVMRVISKEVTQVSDMQWRAIFTCRIEKIE